MEKPAIEGGTPVRESKIFYGHQYIDEADIQAVVDVMRSEALTCGPKIGELERKLCELTGAKYAVACSNGTAALHIACLAATGDKSMTSCTLLSERKAMPVWRQASAGKMKSLRRRSRLQLQQTVHCTAVQGRFLQTSIRRLIILIRLAWKRV